MQWPRAPAAYSGWTDVSNDCRFVDLCFHGGSRKALVEMAAAVLYEICVFTKDTVENFDLVVEMVRLQVQEYPQANN